MGLQAQLLAPIVIAVQLQLCHGHGVLISPISRAITFERNVTKGVQFGGSCPSHACEWYTQDTVLPAGQKTTICDPLLRTYGVSCDTPSPPGDYPCTPGEAVPWCAPGTAPVASPCGVFAGGLAPVAGGRDMRDLPDTPMAKWTKGTVAEVVWAITANHGGGYAYRLCPQGSDLSEDCFQHHHLQFADRKQQILDVTGKVVGEKDAVRVSKGTFPPGSMWTQNPVPQNKGIIPAFPGLPDMYGRGPFNFSIRDWVQVPQQLNAGKYVLSFRWDAEQTKQVWAHCSDVVVADQEGSASSAKAVQVSPWSFVSFFSKPYVPSGKHLCKGESFGLEVDQCDAWVDLYDALNGPAWPSDPGCDSRLDPCSKKCKPTWPKSIVCTALRDLSHITEIYLLGPHIQGVVPASIANFKSLQALSFVSTRLRGPLPTAMGELPQLTMLWLDHNPELGGSIPASFAKLPTLAAFELHRSNFSGPLPAMDFKSIADCHLEHGDFACPLPEGAASCGASCKNSSYLV